MTGMRQIAARADRSAKIANAHRRLHQVAKSLTPVSSAVSLTAAVNELEEIARVLDRVRLDDFSAELREAAREPLAMVRG